MECQKLRMYVLKGVEQCVYAYTDMHSCIFIIIHDVYMCKLCTYNLCTCVYTRAQRNSDFSIQILSLVTTTDYLNIL